jgi:hypothetical protein
LVPRTKVVVVLPVACWHADAPKERSPLTQVFRCAVSEKMDRLMVFPFEAHWPSALAGDDGSWVVSWYPSHAIPFATRKLARAEGDENEWGATGSPPDGFEGTAGVPPDVLGGEGWDAAH